MSDVRGIKYHWTKEQIEQLLEEGRNRPLGMAPANNIACFSGCISQLQEVIKQLKKENEELKEKAWMYDSLTK